MFQRDKISLSTTKALRELQVCALVALGQSQNLNFLIQIICWAPSISGLRALGSLQFFLKPAFTLQLGLNVHTQNESCTMYA